MDKLNKKKKNIYPISVLRFVWLALWFFVAAASVAGIIILLTATDKEWYYIISVFGAFVFLIVSLVIFFADFRRGVKFDTEGIEVKEDFADKFGLITKRFQHELKLNYKDIKDISIEYSTKDTHNRPVKYTIRPMPNIVLTLYDDKQERINVDYYNRRQRVAIIDRLKLEVDKSGKTLDIASGKEMWEKAYSNFKL